MKRILLIAGLLTLTLLNSCIIEEHGRHYDHYDHHGAGVYVR